MSASDSTSDILARIDAVAPGTGTGESAQVGEQPAADNELHAAIIADSLARTQHPEAGQHYDWQLGWHQGHGKVLN